MRRVRFELISANSSAGSRRLTLSMDVKHNANYFWSSGCLRLQMVDHSLQIIT